MTTTILDIAQGSEEWLAARSGLVTASVVGKLLTPTLKVADNDTSRGLLATLVGERITGNVDDVYISSDMWRGVEEEPFARDAYSEHHAPVTEVGFMLAEIDGHKVGYSPDGLVGEDGLIEVKSRQQKKHIQTILADAVPAENMAQLQCGLLVSGRAWIDYVSFCGGMPLWVKRVTPDPDWQSAIRAAVEKFEADAEKAIAAYRKAVKGLPVMQRPPSLLNLDIEA